MRATGWVVVLGCICGGTLRLARPTNSEGVRGDRGDDLASDGGTAGAGLGRDHLPIYAWLDVFVELSGLFRCVCGTIGNRQTAA